MEFQSMSADAHTPMNVHSIETEDNVHWKETKPKKELKMAPTPKT